MRRSAYPAVASEFETLEQVCAGASIARFGDGEFKLCRSGAIKSQVADGRLRDRLCAILRASGDCLVGIPNLHADGPKRERWAKFSAMSSLLSPDRAYVSAFISRPDSAPWIDCSEYWNRMASLWRGQAVTVVRGSGKSFSRAQLLADGAASVTEILAPATNAWADYDAILEVIGTPRRVLLGLGPTATVLAVDLCARGVHAIDLGHAGKFWRSRQVAA